MFPWHEQRGGLVVGGAVYDHLCAVLVPARRMKDMVRRAASELRQKKRVLVGKHFHPPHGLPARRRVCGGLLGFVSTDVKNTRGLYAPHSRKIADLDEHGNTPYRVSPAPRSATAGNPIGSLPVIGDSPVSAFTADRSARS